MDRTEGTILAVVAVGGLLYLSSRGGLGGVLSPRTAAAGGRIPVSYTQGGVSYSAGGGVIGAGGGVQNVNYSPNSPSGGSPNSPGGGSPNSPSGGLQNANATTTAGSPSNTGLQNANYTSPSQGTTNAATSA
jgi:hypothetical protein